MVPFLSFQQGIYKVRLLLLVKVTAAGGGIGMNHHHHHDYLSLCEWRRRMKSPVGVVYYEGGKGLVFRLPCLYHP